MTTERDAHTRIVLSWLREDAHENAERVLMRALDEVDATPQLRSWWPARRFTVMRKTSVRYGIAAAVVVVVAILGYNLLPRTGGVGNSATPPPTPSSAPSPNPSPSPAASPGPWVLTDGPLVAHEYFTRPFAPPNETVTFTFTVPEGWEGFAGVGALPITGGAGPAGMGFGFTQVQRLYSDPCQSTATGDVIVGATVDDLATALQEQTGYEATSPTDVTLDGYSGLRMDLQLPVNLPCENTSFFVFEGGIYAQGPGNRWHLWIIDVDGARAVILAQDFAATSTEDQAELQGIVDSIKITR